MTSIFIGLMTSIVIAWLSVSMSSNDGRRVEQLHMSSRQRRRLTTRVERRFALPVKKFRVPFFVSLDDRETRYLGCSLLLAFSLLLTAPIVTLLPLLAWVTHTYFVRRARTNARIEQIEKSLPMTVDLLRLAVGAGLNITAALVETTTYSTGPLTDELRRALGEARRGRRLADALEDVIGRTTEAVRPLIWSLVSTERYGAALSDVLERLARETRADQERRAEIAARRLSVQVLFPLAGCVLPAFALLTVVPLLAGSLTTLASNFR